MTTKTHSMEDIRASASTPMKAKPLPVNSHDDRMQASTLAAEVVALARQQRPKWKDLAVRVMNLTPEGRTMFINLLKAEKGGLTKAQTEHGFEDKFSKGITKGFAVQMSELQSVANAWNSGGSIEGLVAYVNGKLADKSKHATVDDLDHIGYDTIIAYARTFSKAKAGRKADTLLVKLGKFIKAAGDAIPADDDGDDAKLYAELVAFYNARV